MSKITLWPLFDGGHLITMFLKRRHVVQSKAHIRYILIIQLFLIKGLINPSHAHGPMLPVCFQSLMKDVWVYAIRFVFPFVTFEAKCLILALIEQLEAILFCTQWNGIPVLVHNVVHVTRIIVKLSLSISQSLSLRDGDLSSYLYQSLNLYLWEIEIELTL